MRLIHPLRAGLPALVCLLVVLTACVPITRPTPTAPDGPHVTLAVEPPGMVRPGEPVVIRVRGDAETVALRLAIEGADTGWRNPAQLADGELLYTWIASEPDTYTIIGQARNAAGGVTEQAHTLIVLPYAEPARRGATRIIETKVTLPTYPLEEYLRPALDPDYAWPYWALDRAAYDAAPPQIRPRRYRLVILENDYVQVSFLPELGGRLWQILHKPSGDTMFYQNAVVKPSPWGPAQQLGWLALGGLEWALPVNEHGYDWGTPWEFTTFQDTDGTVGARIATPDDGRFLSAVITVTLAPDTARVRVQPSLHNRAGRELDVHFWQTAMLAPGAGNRVGPDLRFVIPARTMMIHSTGDPMLPGPQQRISWPVSYGRDLSRLGNWFRYLGLFEYPAAHGPFVGVYDPELDAGAVRIFPATVAQGSKLFGLGWRDPIGSDAYTDDGSTYVELHGGLSPSFFEPYRLAADESVEWEETWYPIAGSGGLVYATELVALGLAPTAAGWRAGLYPTQPLSGTLVVRVAGEPATRYAFDAAPDAPFVQEIPRSRPAALPLRPLTVQVEDHQGRTLLVYTASRE